MPIVLYTNLELEVGSLIDTREYTGLNEEALRHSTPEEEAVERLLEEVRRTEFPDAPERLSSVLGIPIPRAVSHVYLEEKGWYGEIPTPEPAGFGAHCYHIERAPGSKTLSVDEGLVGELVLGWDELEDLEKRDLATDYWSGQVKSGYSILIEGPIRIAGECGTPRGERKLKALRWEAD